MDIDGASASSSVYIHIQNYWHYIRGVSGVLEHLDIVMALESYCTYGIASILHGLGGSSVPVDCSMEMTW